MFREAMKEQGKAEDFHNNVMEVKQGNSRAYSIARVHYSKQPTARNTCRELRERVNTWPSTVIMHGLGFGEYPRVLTQ